MPIKDFLNNLLNALLDGSFERMKIINSMNQSFKEVFYSGALDKLCSVSITQGDKDFAHEMSSFIFRSGFKITIKNDSELKDSEIIEISNCILSNKDFIKKLMMLGFDTLIIQGNNTKIGRLFSLKAYANLNNYYIK